MLRKSLATASVIAAAILLSACNSTNQVTSVSEPSSVLSTEASEEVTRQTSSATTSITTEEPAIKDTSEPHNAKPESAEPVTEEIVTIETSADTSEDTEKETAEVPAETTATTAESTQKPVEETAEPPAETTVATENEQIPVKDTAETPAETTPAVIPEEIPEDIVSDPEEILIPADAAQRLADYDIDTEMREKYYTRINKRCDIPIIHVSTKDNAEILSITDYTECLVDVFGCDEQFVISAKEAGIRVRGNSTAYYGDENQIRHNVVPYRIRFNKKTNMLGMNDGAECRSWVLLKSNWNLIMDYTAFNLADDIFDGEYYYSDCEFVHLYVNEEFVGVYVLAEQNQVNPNRVDISEPEADYKGTDIGYFVEIDNYADPEQKPCFNVDYLGATVTDVQGETRQFVPADYSIDSDIYSQNQIDFISKYVNNVFKIVYEATQKDNFLTLDENNNIIDANNKFTNAKDTISEVMDLDSVVNMYVLYEICHDYDCGEGSFYMAVDFSPTSSMKRLTFTAPWDFNWAYNDAAARYYYAGAFNMMNFVNQYGDRTNPWFVLFMTEDWFKDMVSKKWAECYKSGDIPQTLLDIRAYLENNADDLNRKDQWGTDNGYKLLDWVTMRCKWLDREFTEN